MKSFPIAIQPYTIRQALNVDYESALRKVAEIGYQGIELGPPPEGITIQRQTLLLEELGMKVVGTHAGFNTLDFDPDTFADYLDAVNGGRFVAISLQFESRDDVIDKAKKLNQIGERFQQRGITFLYHNHNWEFEQYDGEFVLDILLRETDPALVQTELDTYWIARGGVNPAAYLSQFQGRAPLLHIKDMGLGEEQAFAEIGEGVLDFGEIANVAEQVGVQWMIVEQDECKRDPFVSLAISFRNLQRMGIMKQD